MKKISRGDIIEFRNRYAIVLETTTSDQIIFVPVDVNVQYGHRALFYIPEAEFLKDELVHNQVYAICVIGKTILNDKMNTCGYLRPCDIDEIEAISIMEYNTRNKENLSGGSAESPLALSVGMVAGSASVWNGKRTPPRRASL